MSKSTREEILKKLEKKQISKEKLLELGIDCFSEKTLERIFNCGNFIQAVMNVDRTSSKVVKANRCMNRFCPICMATKSRKDAYMLNIILEYLKSSFDYEFLFLTLTVPNVAGDELVKELNKQYEAIQRLTKRKEFKAVSRGYVRKTEVTYNQERNDFHPHIHMLIVVDKSYFTNYKLYIKHSRWLELWKSCRQNDNISQVNIKKADTNSFKELSKYEAKDFEMLSYSQEVFEYFHNALHGRKTLTYNGCFHIGKKKFQSGELDSFKETDPVEYVDTSFHSYELDISRYKLVKERELSKNEHLKFNNMKIMDERIIE